MDTYELNWRLVAKSGNWDDILWDLNWRKQQARWEHEDRKIREREAELAKVLHSLSPVNDWVGACWVNPDGDLYPVRYSNHELRASEIGPHLYPREWARAREEYGYSNPGEFLCRRGWLRIGGDGFVGDENWNRTDRISTAQFEAIYAMSLRGKAKDSYNTGDFGYGLTESLEYVTTEREVVW